MASERVSIRRTVSAEGARIALDAAVAEARANGWNFSIAVADAAGDLLAFYRMDGSVPVSIDASILKARTVARFGAPSKRLQEMLDGGQLAVLAIPGVAPLGGGVPILLDKVLIGTVGVSGGTVDQDVQVAKVGARAATAELGTSKSTENGNIG
jgi:glc operon protein GlcG